MRKVLKMTCFKTFRLFEVFEKASKVLPNIAVCHSLNYLTILFIQPCSAFTQFSKSCPLCNHKTIFKDKGNVEIVLLTHQF